MSVPAEAEARLRSITVEFDPALAPKGSDAEYASRLLERTVSHVSIDVGGLVQRALADVTRDLPASQAERVVRRTESLVDDVLGAVRANLRYRLGLDLATSLLPRLERNPVQ